ncbi:MAG: flotillin family protein [Fibrobacteria bacterium]|nr:flotillin family protein [Fibrobacteria bacterium]
MPELGFVNQLVVALVLLGLVFFTGLAILIVRCYRKPEQGTAMVRNGFGGSKVSFSGVLVLPVLHRIEEMDISVKRVEIHRAGKEGLICKDNLRADIKVAFFVRVNKTPEDVLKVAQSLGCQRGSSSDALVELFDAKFSEALKTVGKQFNFVDLYNSRESFKHEILQIIGTDLNGYVLDDAAIDYLEQTSLDLLNPQNILDSEGIKKITELTAAQLVLANHIQRDKEKTITRQNVEAREAVLELEKQLAEKEARQKREVEVIQVREQAETARTREEERLRVESVTIRTNEEIAVANENMERQILVARKNRERTEAVETERVEKDRLLEANERERVVSLAQIEKEKALEEEKRKIQDAIRQRVVVERAVVEEEEKIKDTRVLAESERVRKAAVIDAEKVAQVVAVKEVQSAKASRDAATMVSEQMLIEAEASLAASEKQAEAKRRLAEGQKAELSVAGLSEALVIEARSQALEKQGVAEAVVLERKAVAEAKGLVEKSTALKAQGEAEAEVLQRKAVAEAKGQMELSSATRAQGDAEAEVMLKKASAEAKGIAQKAESMKSFDLATRDHEEFRLRLEKEKAVDLAGMEIQKDIARSQAEVLREGLKSARIEIIGGETVFFDKLLGAMTQGKAIDRMVAGSAVLSDVKDTFFQKDGKPFKEKLAQFVDQFGIGSEDLRNLSVSGLLLKMIAKTDNPGLQNTLSALLQQAESAKIAEKPVQKFL